MVRQRAQKEAANRAAVTWSVRVALAIREAPRSHVEGRVIRGEETVTARQGNRVGENGTADSVRYTDMKIQYVCASGAMKDHTWTETSAFDNRLSLFSLKTWIQLQAIDMTVELLRGISNLGIRVPFQERRVL